MDLYGYRFRLLDPPLFWRKLIMLLVFFAGFLVLKAYKQEVGLFYYGIFLLLLHVYVLIVFLYRVRWKILAENGKPFAVRIAAIAVFILILTMIRFDVSFWQLFVVVAASLVVHIALLLSLTVDARPIVAEPARTEA